MIIVYTQEYEDVNNFDIISDDKFIEYIEFFKLKILNSLCKNKKNKNIIYEIYDVYVTFFIEGDGLSLDSFNYIKFDKINNFFDLDKI